MNNNSLKFIDFLPMLYLSIVDLKLTILLQHLIDVIFFILMGSLFITNEVKTSTLISGRSIFHVPELKLWKIIINTFRYTVQLNNLMQDNTSKKINQQFNRVTKNGDTRNTVKYCPYFNSLCSRIYMSLFQLVLVKVKI